MLDIFAFLLPLVMMVLWFAGQNRTKQIDHEVAEMATGVTINFKYTTTNIVHFPTTTQPPVLPQDSIAYLVKFANWIQSQDYVLLFLVPLNLIIFAFFVLLYALRETSSEESVAQLGFALTSLFYGALVCVSLVALRSSKRNEESTLIVSVLTTLRALGALAPMVLSEGYELLISQTVLDTWGNFLTIHLLTVLAREYFEVKFVQPDLEQALSIDDANFVADPTTPDPAVRSILTRENLFISAVLMCSLVTTVLVVIPDWHNRPLVIAGFESSIWVSLILEFTITVFVILHIAPMVRGKSFGSIRTRWVVLVVIIGGIILRILFDFAANTNELTLHSYVPFVTTRAFLNFWKESFTQAIPLAFHLLLVVDVNQTPRDAMTTTKQIFCAYLFALHIMAVGLLLESPSAPLFGQAATCVGALLALTDASLVLCKVVPRIAQRVQKDV